VVVPAGGSSAVALPPFSGFLAVVGSRSAPVAAGPWVAGVVSAAVGAGVPVATGGAVGADLLALSALVAGGPSACRLGAVWSAWGPLPAALPRFPVPVRPVLSRFVALGGSVVCGPWVGLPPAAALARRAVALCSSAGLVVCLLASPVPPVGAVGGSWGSVLAAVRAGVPVVVLPWGFSAAALPPVLAGVPGVWCQVSGPVGSLGAALAGGLLFVPSAPRPTQLALF
jgi:hypothetical protein